MVSFLHASHSVLSVVLSVECCSCDYNTILHDLSVVAKTYVCSHIVCLLYIWIGFSSLRLT